ncbi:YlaH-like family protein [Desertibacillus haloalkaliphilus]|uniref:YlaH-like family protein n=1 Tax=Desertibacillus haloalkaliphilus TaxID=1328930 RepID=UPI001C26C656|nr:YlaH-like family protein [Desertibacillus haloalkaliphilus]MBU8906733.1 YlaH-like family protein [Desertibacillus haloalkaliphilus]
MEEVQIDEVQVNPEDLSTFAALVNIDQNPVFGFWMLYAIIVILSIVVYNLGFARKLPVLKSAIVYIALFVGCIPITIFAIGMPVIESLIVAAIILGVYKFNLARKQKEEAEG